MNNAQIKNGDVRIFPYYKGEYMGKSEVEYGFSNEQSARKYMKQIPDEDIYDSIGGYEKYFQENLIQEISKKICSGNLVGNSKKWRKKF